MEAAKATAAPLLLHGTLYATILGIDQLNYGCHLDSCQHPIGPYKLQKRFLATIKGTVIGPRIYATIDLDTARLGRTRRIRRHASHPRWEEHFRLYCAHTIANVVISVKDDSPIGAILIGRAYIPAYKLYAGNPIDDFFPILDEDRNPVAGNSTVQVRLQFHRVTVEPTWSRGIQDPNFDGVPYTFFRQRHGCKVTLYHDAHVPDSFNSSLPPSIHSFYESRRCWEDMFSAIVNAKHLIYIAGWSIYTEIKLVRDKARTEPEANLTLGKLLLKKANEDVTVLVLVWDDRTSIDVLKTEGVMRTHDQETKDYFRYTKVHCVLCPRNPDDKRSAIQGFKIATMFTHHQKVVVVDCEAPSEASGKRRIVSFIGGIDLCDGRYDTQEHSLFRTLNSVHADDFHQPNFPGASIRKGGPREPWHDIHCKLEGPVAWDVLFNFEQRWRKQAGIRIPFLLSLKELRALTIPPSPVCSPDDKDSWNVQIFRSIDGGAISNFRKGRDDAVELGLVGGKDTMVERSIQDAYINAIRRAKNFIYMENQYFLGSSFGWNSIDIRAQDIGALHLIPKEISLKIASKIEAGERFSAYIVLPMWPEGTPDGAAVQAILDWQRRTMEMMYNDVAQAIRKKGLKTHPREYLTFFCLGNRETKRPGEEYKPPEQPDPNSAYGKAQKSRRFMIYVHSKMMIVDDEYIIVGSANINQRSMGGSRDSEIAMGAFQPQHLVLMNKPARGQIFGFRMALWYEHLKQVHDSFERPESIECVNLVNHMAQDLWEKYTSESFDEDLPGHLLQYPVDVTDNGGVTYNPNFQAFPDTQAPVLGTKSAFLPPILTT